MFGIDKKKFSSQFLSFFDGHLQDLPQIKDGKLLEEAAEKCPKKIEAEKDSKLIDEFLDDLAKQAYSDATINAYKNDFSLIHQFTQTHPLKLTLKELEQYIEWLAQVRGNQAAIIHRRLASLNGFSKWAAQKGLPFPPVLAIKRPKKQLKSPQFLAPEILAQLNKEIEAQAYFDRECSWAALLLVGGLRVSEIQTVIVDENELSIGTDEKDMYILGGVIMAFGFFVRFGLAEARKK